MPPALSDTADRVHTARRPRRTVRGLRLLMIVLAAALTSLMTLMIVSPAAAAVTEGQRLAALASFTQTSAASYNRWNEARQNQSSWADYHFDFSTDYCSVSPDQPLGFDFRLSCARHDFGYRNYRAVGTFPANKARLDSAFYADLKRKCATYEQTVRPACLSIAWIYYQAVVIFGSVVISQAELDRAAQLKAEGLAAASGAA